MNIPSGLRVLAKELGSQNSQLNDYLDVIKLRDRFEESVKNVEDTFRFTRCSPPFNFTARVAQIRQLFVVCLSEEPEESSTKIQETTHS